MRVGYMSQRQPPPIPRQPWSLACGLQYMAHFGFRVARCKSVSILEFERQYLITPNRLWHGQSSQAFSP